MVVLLMTGSESRGGAAVAYKQHPIEEIDVVKLHVDQFNFRIADQQPSEAAIMNYLYDVHDAFDVASLILRDGYIDNELPIVIVEDGNYVIVEGNRRLTALRTLLDPAIAPSKEAAIRRLLKRYSVEAANLPNRIRVMVLPDRAAVAPVLARLHIGESKKAWNLDEQAKFVFAQLNDGLSVQQLKDTLPAIKDVVRLVRMGRMREVLRSANYADPAVGDYAANKLTMSAFEYGYRNSLIQFAIGIKFDRDGNLVSRPSTEAEFAAFELLVLKYKTKELSTRKVPKAGSEAFSNLISELMGGPAATAEESPDVVQTDASEPAVDGEAGDVDGTSTDDNLEPEVADPNGDNDVATDDSNSDPTGDVGDSSADDDLEPELINTDGDEGIPDGGDVDSEGGLPDTANTDESDPGNPLGPRPPNNPDAAAKLNMSGINYSHAAPGIHTRLRELARIEVTKFPVAAVLLLRSILESSVKDHYAQRQLTVSGELGPVAQELRKTYGQKKAVNRQVLLLSGQISRGDVASLEWFNTVSHNSSMKVDGPAVHHAWQEMMPLVRFLLIPASTTGV